MGFLSDAGNWIYDNVISPVGDWWNDTIQPGLENWWYKNTGQAHLTTEYQHEEELANSAYQRAAEDMQKAGLSKFGGVNPASSPSPKSGSGLLATAMAGAQLKGQLLSNKEERHNISIAKKWGIPTSATGEVAKYDAACKFLFGKSIMDMVGQDGLMGLIQSWLGKGSGDSGATPPGDPVAGSAAVDVLQHVNQDLSPIVEPVYSSIFGDSNVYKPAPIDLPAVIAYEPNVGPNYEPLKFEPFSSEHFKKPSASETVSKALGADVKKDVNQLMVKMLNDNQLSDKNMDRVAYSLSIRYGYSKSDIVSYMQSWIDANNGDIVHRWE